MTNRRTFVALSALTASLFPLQKVLAQTGESSTPATTGEADFLFVQTSKSMSYDPATKKLTLVEASPVTLFFRRSPRAHCRQHGYRTVYSLLEYGYR
jgi:hypothetical protein